MTTEPRGQMPDPCRYWQPLDIEPPSPIRGWLLMPIRLIVAAFLHMEQSMKPDIDTERFGYMFRSADTDDRTIRRAVEQFDERCKA
jgi:hypothetical protein